MFSCTLISLLVSLSISSKRRQKLLIQTEWVSGTRDAVAQWETQTSGNVTYHKVSRQIQIEFDESDKPEGNGMAEWGNVYYATDSSSASSVQTGPDNAVRSAFVANGKLDGSLDTNYRVITDNWPVFAFASDLGNVGAEFKSQLFSIGLLQQNAVQFLGADGLVSLPSLWTSYYANEAEAVS